MDPDYPMVKRQIVQKVGQLFQLLGQKLGRELEDSGLIGSAEYKISRGENYRNMPYTVLDFPRITGNNFPVVCRTLFWWGHYFSCTLLVQTSLIDIQNTASLLAQKGKLKLYTGSDLWEQDLNNSGFVKLNTIKPKEISDILAQQEYLKVSCKITLKDFENLETLAVEAYSKMLSRISIKKGAV
jgi:hypothetical protein